MPARVIITLILLTIAAAGLTVALAHFFDIPMPYLGLVFVGAALAARLWGGAK